MCLVLAACGHDATTVAPDAAGDALPASADAATCGTRTGMRARAYPGEDPNSLPTPDAVTYAYLYLLGPDSRGVNGQRLALRG